MDCASPWEDWDLLLELRRTSEIFDHLREASAGEHCVGGSPPGGPSQQAPSGRAGAELRLQQQLRRRFPDRLVRAALHLAELRRRAAGKFTHAAEMWFDRKGLEQSTAEAVARHKAQRFTGRVWDYGCGIGSDATALARRCEVVAVDVDPAQCLRTKWNAEIYGVDAALHVVAADVQDLTDRSGFVHVDPDRRRGALGRRQARGRTLRLEDAVPGLDFLQRVCRQFAGGAIKVSPASNFPGKFPAAEIELVSLDGECKEATVWFGELRGEVPFRATLLPSGDSLAADPLEFRTHVGALGTYLHDPDPAVVRAGLVDVLAERFAMVRLDASEEYLSSDTLAPCPFVRSFRVVAELPNSERAIRTYFRHSDFAQVEIKCRHIPVNADAVRRKLVLGGHRHGVLIFARLAGKARALVCERVETPGSSRNPIENC